MLKLLVKKQLYEIFRTYFYNAKKNTVRSKAATISYFILFALLMVVFLGGVFTALASTLCESLAAAGLDWMYFAIMGLISIAFGAFGSVFNTYASVYLAKDNDQLLSLPIPVSALMASRLVTVYLLGFLYSAVVSIPTAIVYRITVGATTPAVLGSLLSVLLISVFVFTLSCALGWVVAKISLKLKRRSFATVLCSIAFFGAYYFFYFKANALIQFILQNAERYAAVIEHSASPIYLFGKVGTGDAIACLIVGAVVMALFALMWLLLSRSFLKTVTATGNSRRKKYRSVSLKSSSAATALLRREFSRFAASPVYILNCGFGVLLMFAVGVFLLIRGSETFSMLNGIGLLPAGGVPILICALLCALIFTVNTAVPSVSLEGKSLWLAQSLPIAPWQILRSKIEMQLILGGIPAVFFLICFFLIYPLSLPALLALTGLTLSCVLLSSLFGMFLGVKMPNLHWTSEVTPIKQSGAIMIILLCGMLLPALIAMGYLLLFGWQLGLALYAAIVTAVLLALCFILYRWLKTTGSKILAAL